MISSESEDQAMRDQAKIDKEKQATVINPVKSVVRCNFNREKAVDEFAVWLNESGVSFVDTNKFSKKCPELAKLLGL